MKGILLAGGTSSRMGPAAALVTKQLIPVYDKPLIYYPLSTLMLAGIREILVIVRPDEKPAVASLLGDGSSFGLFLNYATQDEPKGIAHALLIAHDFLADDPCCLVLGDNVLLGAGLGTSLRQLMSREKASILGYPMADPSAYAVASLRNDGGIASLAEKPASASPGMAVPGIYFYPPGAAQLAATLKPSSRGELEITDLNVRYLSSDRLDLRPLPRSSYWMDAGTPDRLLDASVYVRSLSEREGTVIACPEEIAFSSGWMGPEVLQASASRFEKSRYGRYLWSLLERET